MRALALALLLAALPACRFRAEARRPCEDNPAAVAIYEPWARSQGIRLIDCESCPYSLPGSSGAVSICFDAEGHRYGCNGHRSCRRLRGKEGKE